MKNEPIGFSSHYIMQYLAPIYSYLIRNLGLGQFRDHLYAVGIQLITYITITENISLPLRFRRICELKGYWTLEFKLSLYIRYFDATDQMHQHRMYTGRYQTSNILV